MWCAWIRIYLFEFSTSRTDRAWLREFDRLSILRTFRALAKDDLRLRLNRSGNAIISTAEKKRKKQPRNNTTTWIIKVNADAYGLTVSDPWP